uniref:Uncharacterized protein n=1 Tax=Quercus lobata TaxID=97700 RepID=A0A7N2LQE6_QUELO
MRTRRVRERVVEGKNMRVVKRRRDFTAERSRRNSSDIAGKRDLFDSLPDDLVISILCKLSPSVFANVLLTCRSLNGLGLNSLVKPDSRQGIVNKIMETLKRHLHVSGQEGLYVLGKFAIRFEEKIYTAATNQSDYLAKIFLKLLTLENWKVFRGTFFRGLLRGVSNILWWLGKRRIHGCGLWRSINEGWESFSKHLSFVVGEGTRIRFWHYRWIGDNTLKDLYPDLYVCSAVKDACISEVLWMPEGGTVRVWDLRSDTLCWRLKGDGNFDTRSYYHAIRGASNSLFPWKGVWKPKIPKRVAFFLWTAAHGRILTLDNLMLRGRSLATWCCMCCCDGESVDHLLLHCPVTHSLWTFMFQAFGCLMWIVWLERNRRSFEGNEKTLDELKVLCQPSLDYSTAQTGHANGAGWQEEVYQKIETMKDLYLPEINEMYQKIAAKLQQHYDSLPQQSTSDLLEKLKVFKIMLERIITFLQVSKNNISPGYKEKLGSYEKQIVNCIKAYCFKKPALQQGQLPAPHMQTMQQPPQLAQIQSHENQMNPQLQSMNLQGSVPTMPQNSMSSLQHNSVSLSGASTAQPNMMNSLQPGSNLDSGQGNSLSSLQPVTMGCH